MSLLNELDRIKSVMGILKEDSNPNVGRKMNVNL
jgi:hypothetical protein